MPRQHAGHRTRGRAKGRATKHIRKAATKVKAALKHLNRAK